MHRKTAQAIAQTTSEVIGYGVLVTDERGIIIGCNDTKRVGTLHLPSLGVMRTGQPVSTSREEAAGLDGVKPGYTAPIALSDQVVGTISIAGPPHKAERYGLLVRKQAEILLMEQAFLELKLRQQLAVRDLAENIMLYRPEDENSGMLVLHGRELGFDLERCRIAVILELRESRSRQQGQDTFRNLALNRIVNFLANPAHLIAPLRNRQIALFLALPCSSREGEMEETALHLCEALSDHLGKDGLVAELGIGLEADTLPLLTQSAHLAREALSTGRALGMRICPARALNAEMLLSYIPAGRKRQHIERVLHSLEDSDSELTDTFLAWCRNPFAPAEVARSLSIHRNTLQYRLKKLRNLLGLDPWNFHDCFAIWSALILKKFGRHARSDGV
ncbi:CdaR family transcriptional regulator [Fretibacterium sp. OH1220_COT-178]|uniref:CdaR family transcriptional regulator n=1 Tax=Fretibacterium sp. OH1220_COT-178 TaxID=2491047 RepID=UPI000F5D6840|nr:sugar diacid recognition domain-containing protein [Fretibacterium sp. OH1220_COT-178]RRD64426.1 hypothetical protein EII26_07180 [Fretibacterium sp. OH1220_COT-178]